jgi:hypothetical protein
VRYGRGPNQAHAGARMHCNGGRGGSMIRASTRSAPGEIPPRRRYLRLDEPAGITDEMGAAAAAVLAGGERAAAHGAGGPGFCYFSSTNLGPGGVGGAGGATDVADPRSFAIHGGARGGGGRRGRRARRGGPRRCARGPGVAPRARPGARARQTLIPATANERAVARSRPCGSSLSRKTPTPELRPDASRYVRLSCTPSRWAITSMVTEPETMVATTGAGRGGTGRVARRARRGRRVRGGRGDCRPDRAHH